MKLDYERGHLGKVFDANGKEILYCLRCNTETGEVVEYVRDEKGKLKLTEDGNRILTQTNFYPAPLRFEPDEVTKRTFL